jgi:hypothetical protein
MPQFTIVYDFCEVLFNSLTHVLLSLLSCRNFSYILDPSPLSDKCFENIFSQSYVLLIYFLNVF